MQLRSSLTLLSPNSSRLPQLLLSSGKQGSDCFIVTLLYLLFAGIFGWAMGSGPVKGFNSEEVQQIVTRKHDPGQNKIAKEDGQTATFAAGAWSLSVGE